MLHLCTRKEEEQRERTFSLARNSYPASFVLQSEGRIGDLAPFPQQAKEKMPRIRTAAEKTEAKRRESGRHLSNTPRFPGDVLHPPLFSRRSFLPPRMVHIHSLVCRKASVVSARTKEEQGGEIARRRHRGYFFPSLLRTKVRRHNESRREKGRNRA